MVAVSKNRGYVQITLPRMTHTHTLVYRILATHSTHILYQMALYIRVNRRRGPTNEKEYNLYSLMFQQMVEFFFIVTATGNRDKQENNKKRARKKKKSVGFCHRKNPPPKKRDFFFSNWQSKGKNSWILIHTQTRARESFIIFLIAKGSTVWWWK